METPSTGLLYLYAVLCLMTLLFHSIGLYLLWTVKSRLNIYYMYIVSLSIAEILALLAFLVKICLLIDSPLRSVEDIVAYTDIVRYATFCFCYYMVKIYLLFDQLASIFLAVRYKAHWTRNKVNGLLKCTWFVGIVLCLAVIFGTDWYRKIYALKLNRILFYIDIGFLSLFLFCLLLLVFKTKLTTVCPGNEENDDRTARLQISPWKLLLRSNYAFTCALSMTLIISHFLTHALVVYDGDVDENDFIALYIISYYGDAVVYIIMMPNMRRLLRRKFKKLFVLCCSAN